MQANRHKSILLSLLFSVSLLGFLMLPISAWALPDLAMSSWSLSVSSARGHTSPVTITYNIANLGTTNAGQFEVLFYYSDAQSFSGLTQIGTATVANLAAGQTTGNRTLSITLPANVAWGVRYIHYHINPTNQVAESTTANNSSNHTSSRPPRSITITGLPDLEVSFVGVTPAKQVAGGPLSVAYRVYNAGYSRVTTLFENRLYYSADDIITTGDTYLVQTATVSTLNARSFYPSTGNDTVTVTVPAAAQVGKRYIGMIADYNNRINNEEREDNNTRAGEFEVVAQKPELSMKTFTGPSSATGHPAQITITYDVQNTGSGNATKFEVAFYYAHTTAFSDLTLLQAVTINSLAAGANTGNQTVVLTLPPHALYGTRYIHYWVDYRSEIDEINENNNRGYRAISLTGRPNLQVSALVLTPNKQVAGGEVSVSFTVTNVGATRANANTITRFYYSEDNRLTTNTDPNLQKDSTVPLLDAGRSHTATVVVILPMTGITVGTRYIFAYADITNTLVETNESDNTRSSVIEIIPAMPDLEMAAWSAPASTPGFNNKISILYTVQNRGNSDAAESTLSFYYGESNQFTSLTKLGDVAIALLQAGQSASGTFVATMPDIVSTGNQYIHYFIDSENKVTEIRESNNTGHRTIEITGFPNLQISVLSIKPTSQIAGGEIDVTYRVVNSGLAKTPATHITRIYYSVDATIDDSDTLLRALSVPVLKAGELWPTAGNGITTVIIPTNAQIGSPYVGAFTDFDDRIKESNENDNTKAVALQLIDKIPDLEMDSWSFTPSSTAGAGDEIDLTLAVANKGQADAGPFTVTFYYGDSTSIANIETLGNANLNGVLAGQSSSPINLKFKLPNTILSGKRYIHYYIDSADRIGEITEANNRGHREIEITGLPNLQISEFAISPANQRANGHIIITYRVINSGKSRVPSTSRLAFYHSTDATIDATDALRTWITVPVLEAGASHPEKDKDSGNITITVPATAISGATEYIGIFADYNDQIQESNEADNTKAEPFRVVDAMVDLLIHSWSFSPEKVSGYNSAISIDFRVRNSGNADALTQFDVSFYYSDSTSTEGMVFLGKESVRRVDQNTIDSTRTVIANLPRSALTGKRYIHYFIDSDNKIIEYRKDNNRGFAEIEITGLPNLQVSVLSISPTTQAPGSSIDVTYRLYNGGLTRADNFKIGFYHSTDANIDTKDTLLHTINVSKLEAQSFEPAVGNATVSVRLPTSIPPGAAYIGTYVDNEDVIKELAETDNTRYTAITISAPKPDLEATILRIAPVTQKVNQTVTVTYTISNRGGQDAVAFRVGIYYSADAIISDTDTLLTTFTVNVVKSNDQHSSSQSVTLPVSLPGGAGYIGIFVDDDKKIDETDEANNTASTAITVLVDRDGDKYYSDVDCDDNDPDVYPGAPEICNGKDNNCDGLIDNDPKCICKSTDPPRPCYSGSTGCTKQADESYQCVGTCKAGTQSCINGQWAACVGEVTPQIEICDGLDNNCNSLVDENLTRHCYTGTTGCTQQADGSYQCNNPCRAGTQTCINGQWDVCNGEVIASTETCDGIDNDCDGQIDNQPGTANPLEQPCSNTCGSGVEVCLNGQWQNCSAPLTCEPTDEPITPDGGGIIDQAPETPPNCYVTGCPPDQICKAGQCVNNPCYNITCQPDQFCRDGQCIDACDCTVCSVGKSCIDGQCVIDPCSGVSCPAGDICDPLTGQCKADPCQGVSCDSGLICEDGRCIDDPCKFIKCPQDQVCRKAQCVGQQCEQEPTIEPFTPDASDPDAATPDAADPDTATPDAADPDTATPDAADPDTATPDAADPDAADPDAADPDTATPDAADLDAPKSDAEVQDKVIPGTDRDQVDSVEPPQGCACNVAQSTPISLLFFVLLFSLITLRRKRNHA